MIFDKLTLADWATQRPHSRQGREGAGRFASRLEATYSPLSIVADTVRQWWRDGRTDYGLPTFFRFARFRVMGVSSALIVLELGRETAQTEKGWPSFRSSLSRSRSCRYLRQSTECTCSLDLSPQSTTLRRATLGWKHEVVALSSHTLAPPHAYSLRSRVSVLRLRREIKGSSALC